jgi:hypothetical protein
VYELCSESATALKLTLAERVAQLGSDAGWEKANTDFKL